jgi:hypothetical protein
MNVYVRMGSVRRHRYADHRHSEEYVQPIVGAVDMHHPEQIRVSFVAYRSNQWIWHVAEQSNQNKRGAENHSPTLIHTTSFKFEALFT